MNDIAQEQPSPDDDRTRMINTPAAPGDGVTAVPMPDHDTQGDADDDVTILPVGSRLAEFEITALIGQGGFGTVYEAHDHVLERTVAIKEYLPVSLSTRQRDGTVRPLSKNHRETFELGMNSFINEARLLAQFDHPALLKVHRFWQEHGTAYMVMPYYRGPTLRQALAAMPGRANEEQLLSIIDELTQAIAVMHRANCYHRDIAPDNILLLEGLNRPVLLDFGAARRVISDKTQTITAILKPGYAPIEQYAEMPDMPQGAWTDIYALAAVLHVAITGHTPPPSVARLLTDSYTPVAPNTQLQQQFSTRLLTAVDAGLAVRPEARPQSVGAFRTLLGLSEGVTTTTQRSEPITASVSGKNAVAAPAPVSKKNNMPRMAMAAIPVLLVLAAGFAWWMRGGEASPVADVPKDKTATETKVLPPPTLPTEESAPAPTNQALVPAPANQAPIPAPANQAPIPEPANQAPIPEPTNQAPIPEPVNQTTTAPQPRPPAKSPATPTRSAAGGGGTSAETRQLDVFVSGGEGGSGSRNLPYGTSRQQQNPLQRYQQPPPATGGRYSGGRGTSRNDNTVMPRDPLDQPRHSQSPHPPSESLLESAANRQNALRDAVRQRAQSDQNRRGLPPP